MTLAEYLLPFVPVATARIVSEPCAGKTAGAVYKPPVSPVVIVPVAALPPCTDPTSHFRAEIVKPLAAAVNCIVPPTETVRYPDGDMLRLCANAGIQPIDTAMANRNQRDMLVE